MHICPLDRDSSFIRRGARKRERRLCRAAIFPDLWQTRPQELDTDVGGLNLWTVGRSVQSMAGLPVRTGRMAEKVAFTDPNNRSDDVCGKFHE